MFEFSHISRIILIAITAIIALDFLVFLCLVLLVYRNWRQHKPDKPAPEWWMGIGSTWVNYGPYPSREAAIEDAKSFDWGGCWVGVRGTYAPFSRDLVEDLWEQECCSVGDACGPDASDNWPDRFNPKDPEVVQANVEIRAIMNRLFGPCSVWPIENMEFVDLKEAVVEA